MIDDEMREEILIGALLVAEAAAAVGQVFTDQLVPEVADGDVHQKF